MPSAFRERREISWIGSTVILGKLTLSITDTTVSKSALRNGTILGRKFKRATNLLQALLTLKGKAGQLMILMLARVSTYGELELIMIHWR